ncbi:MAG: nuclear transport factor 2 family protein [Pseudomonadota bacterium]
MFQRLIGIFSVSALCALTPTAMIGQTADDDDALARELIDRFYTDLGPDRDDLQVFLGESFQIIGSDGLHFDKAEYLSFPKSIVDYDVSDLTVRRDNDLLTATFEITYTGQFEGTARSVPSLPRIAVFAERGGEWSLIALAALGTGENDVTTASSKAIYDFFAAIQSGDRDKIRAVLAPDFQVLRVDGSGYTLEDYLASDLPTIDGQPVIEDLVATSFSNTMVTRYVVTVDETRDGKTVEAKARRMTVFQRINGTWLVAAHANFATIN